MNNKVLIISLVIFFICLVGKILLWQRLSEPPIPPAAAEISKDNALELANQSLGKKCNLSFSQIERVGWTKALDIEDLKREICPTIDGYNENEIWRGKVPLDENIEIVALVGVYGKFVCLYGLDKRAAPGIMSVDEACAQSFAKPSVANPAAVYCEKLGYKDEIRTDPKTKGQYGVCIFPDGSECEEWAFYRGKCGQKFTFCEQQGFRIENRIDNMGTWSAEYAVCVFDDGSECLEQDYFDGKCSPSECKKWKMSEGGCVKSQ